MWKGSVMDLGMEGRVAIVTGASKGLGRACAEALVAEGVKVLAVARDTDALNRLQEAAPDAVCIAVCDMLDRDAVSRLPSRAIEAFGRLDIVVNNAGLGGRSPLMDQDWARWEQQLAVNVTAPAVLSTAAAQHFAGQRSGKVVNIASTTSIRGVAGLAGYSASKGALLQLTRALALEWAPIGVQVNAIGPGAFETDPQQALLMGPKDRLEARLDNIPDHRMGRPPEVGALVCFLSSPLSDHVTGALYMIDGGESVQLLR
jgi:2-deoxy-D-gluconate 3-dehydrogenase